jgi:hypothetical protein
VIAIRQVQDLTLAGPLLARALAYDTGGEGGQLADLVRGCCIFEMWHGARLVGAFTAHLDSYSDGRQINVTAAGGVPGYDLVGAIDAWLSLQAAGPGGARALTCTTRRPGLVRRLKRAGYTVAGYVMRKEVAHGIA